MAIGSLVTLAFGETLLSACGGRKDSADAVKSIVDSKAAPIVRHWAAEMQDICSDLGRSNISPVIWQERIESLFERVELKELLNFIDFETLSERISFPDLGVGTQTVKFPSIAGLPSKTVFIKKIFGMKKGRAIVPHGHSNMASAHLILKGDFHLRHFEKTADEGDVLRIRPSIDRRVTAGDCSSISDERDNVHWFIAETDEAFTFDVIMLDLEGGKYKIHNIDIDDAEKAGGGELIVPKIDVAAALEKYGKQHHEGDSV